MSYYSSRSIAQPNTNADETYTTINLYVNSQIGSIPLEPYTDINAGFTVQLANPIILDIDHRYAMCLIKAQYDISKYTDKFYTFDIRCDLIEYQYEYNNKTQLLYQVYGNKYDPTGQSDNINLALVDITNVVWKFVNPTQKIINRISFWIIDPNTNLPLTTPLATDPSGCYPTELSVLIKKVNSRVIATTIF